jgi:hypothetical protein
MCFTDEDAIARSIDIDQFSTAVMSILVESMARNVKVEPSCRERSLVKTAGMSGSRYLIIR